MPGLIPALSLPLLALQRKIDPYAYSTALASHLPLDEPRDAKGRTPQHIFLAPDVERRPYSWSRHSHPASSFLYKMEHEPPLLRRVDLHSADAEGCTVLDLIKKIKKDDRAIRQLVFDWQVSAVRKHSGRTLGRLTFICGAAAHFFFNPPSASLLCAEGAPSECAPRPDCPPHPGSDRHLRRGRPGNSQPHARVTGIRSRPQSDLS